MRPQGIGVRLPDVNLTGIDPAGLAERAGLIPSRPAVVRPELVGDVVIRGVRFDRKTGAPKSNAEVNPR